jgi:hypothetical protein
LFFFYFFSFFFSHCFLTSLLFWCYPFFDFLWNFSTFIPILFSMFYDGLISWSHPNCQTPSTPKSNLDKFPNNWMIFDLWMNAPYWSCSPEYVSRLRLVLWTRESVVCKYLTILKARRTSNLDLDWRSGVFLIYIVFLSFFLFFNSKTLLKPEVTRTRNSRLVHHPPPQQKSIRHCTTYIHITFFIFFNIFFPLFTIFFFFSKLL